ncbi:phosphate ABC transporter permease PstA [Guggenheimella bovis]
MRTSRKIKDGILQTLTYLSAILAAGMLLMVFIFVMEKGLPGVNLKLLTNNYWSENIKVEYPKFETGNFKAPETMTEGAYFSPKTGIAIKDSLDAYKVHQVKVEYIDPNSPLKTGIVSTAGKTKGEERELKAGYNINSLMFKNTQGKLVNIGASKNTDAKEFIAELEQIKELRSIFYQTPGGGVRGSLLATLLLIIVSIVIALPIGIAAAIYLNEYAPAGLITELMRSSIEILAGVPSIIFGLMGVSLLFPITQLFGIKSVSILLGALTMAVVLLPLIIRQTEESLRVVPIDLRYGSLSLGATRTQTIFKVILPNALPGIITATLLSISRIIGESAALIYTMGVFINDNPAIDKGATTLAVQIFSLMSGEQPNFELSSTISIIILGIVLILNLTVKAITARLNRKWSV